MILAKKVNSEKTHEIIYKIFENDIINFKIIRTPDVEHKALSNFYEHIDMIQDFYPLYYRRKFKKMDFNNLITISNHFLKCEDLKIQKHETTRSRKKLYTYTIQSIAPPPDNQISFETKRTLVKLD